MVTKLEKFDFTMPAMPAERLYLVPTGATPALDKHLALIWKMDLETRLSLQAYSDAFKKTIRVVTSSGRNAPEDAVTGEWYYKQLIYCTLLGFVALRIWTTLKMEYYRLLLVIVISMAFVN